MTTPRLYVCESDYMRLIDRTPRMGDLIDLIDLELEDHQPRGRWGQGDCRCGNQLGGETFSHHLATMVDYRLTATDGDA